LLLAAAFAQQCPQSSSTGPTIPSEVRTLEGQLVYHNGIRQWFELKLDKPQCEQPSIQLISEKDDWTTIEVLRGCRVKVTGKLDFAGTGYYSLDVFQAVEQIEPPSSCIRQSPFPDYSKAKPDKSIRHYRVDMYINYSPGDHPVAFRVSSAGKELKPWQAYASYLLTGGFVLYGHCADGFAVNKVFGTPEAHPSRDEMAAFDPESAAAVGKHNLHLGYTCSR